MNGSKSDRGCGLLGIALLLFLPLSLSGCAEKTKYAGTLITEVRKQREQGNYSTAVIQLKTLLQESPENAEARYLLGSIYNDTGDFTSAEKQLRTALDLRYDHAKVVPALGKSLLMLGEYQKLLDQIRVEGEVGNLAQAETLTLRGLALLRLGRSREGYESFEQALAKQPEFSDALLGQARLAATEKKLDDAARLIERALVSAPKSIDAWLMKGDLARAMGNSVAATSAYLKVIEFNPENLPARLNTASLQIADGNFDDARKQIDLVRKLSPNNPITAYMEALIEFRRDNHAAAREQVLKILKVAPNHMPSTLLAGAVEFALGSHAQAQFHLARVVEHAPGNLYARKLLVLSLAKSGQALRALEVLQPALNQSPEDGRLMALAGEVYMKNNELIKAGQYFDKAAKLDPKSARARTALGLSRLAAGETDRALADIESAVQLDSDKYQADILLVMWHLQRANFDQALKAVQSLETKQPHNPLTYNLKAAIYIGKEDGASARKNLDRALELQPTYVPAAENLAQLDLREKNPKAARSRFEAILAKDSNNVPALLALANLAPHIGASPQERIDWVERARKASPRSVQPLLMLVRLHAKAGADPRMLLELAQRAAVMDPDDTEVLETLGAVQIAAGEAEQALATFRKLATNQPGSHLALYRLATAQAAVANPAAATASLREALAIKPDFSDAQAALAALELRAGRNTEAMRIARQVQKQSVRSPLGFVLEGDVLMEERKFPQAAKAYETAYTIDKSGGLTIKLHSALTLAGNPDGAAARLAQWLRESPDDVSVRIYAAETALKSGRYKDAIAQCEWLLQKQPDNVSVLNNLAWLYQQVKDSRAMTTAERAYKLKPDSAAVADTLGWMLVEQGNVARGLELLQRAAAAAPKEPSIGYHLALGQLKAGDRAKALIELERILSTDTKFTEHAEALALLKQLREK